MSKLEHSMEKALKLRDKPVPMRRNVDSPVVHSEDRSRMNYHEDEGEAHLRDYIEILIRRKWIVIISLIVVASIGSVATFVMTPLYKASSTIQLKGIKSNILTFQDAYQGGTGAETQYNIMQSKNLMKRVVASLPQNIAPIVPEKHPLVVFFSDLFSSKEKVDSEPLKGEFKVEREKVSLGTIMKGLEIIPIKKTHLVKINFISEDPLFAAVVTNTVADEYINYTRQSKLAPSQVGGERLKKEVSEMRVKLENSEIELNDYIANSKFIFSNNDVNYENLLTRKLSELAKSLDQATSDRLIKEAMFKEVKRSGVDYDFVLNNPIIRTLTQKYIEMEAQYFNLLTIHKPEYPKMIKMKEGMDKLQETITAEKQKIINTLESDYMLAVKKEKVLSSSIETLRKEVTSFQQNLVQLQILKREVETSREIYNTLLQRLKEVDISTALMDSDVQVLDKAQVPSVPFKPQIGYNLILSAILGLFGGVFLAFFAEYFDNSIKSEEDLERITSIPVMGKVPMLKNNPQEIIKSQPSDNIAFAEAFRTISTRIHFSNTSKLKHLLITSSMENEGKTIISISVAMNLISSKENGIIIDADLRKPDIHTLFDLDNSAGLSSFLAGISDFEGLIKKTPYSGLDVITAGPVPPNPSELLNSARMVELLDALSAAYDYVIFDSAPVLGMSDSLILSGFADGVLLVVRANKTPKDAFIQTNKALDSVNANTLGYILNGVEMKSRYAQSSYYYSSSYVNNNDENRKMLK